MSKRSTFNTTVTKNARKAGVYADVIANWTLVQNAYKDGLTPTAALKGIIATLDLSAPAKVTPKVKAPAKAVTPKAVLVPAAELDHPTKEPMPLDRMITAFLGKGQRHVPTTDDMAFPCGWAQVVIEIDLRTAHAKAFMAAGFTRHGTGMLSFAFWADNGQSADAAFEKAAVAAKSLDLMVRVKEINAKVYASTIID